MDAAENFATDEFLLKELSARGFTPAYGFPTNVVEFDSPNFHRRDDDDRPHERFDRASVPSRGISAAIREYAPGADVVVDGLVYRSTGLALAWSRAFELSDIEDLRWAWSCGACRAFGVDAVEPELYGVSEADIARVLGIDPKTLRKHYREELDTGHIVANAKVAESLFRKATGDGRQSVTAAIFWLKTRAGWRERPSSDEDDAPLEIRVVR